MIIVYCINRIRHGGGLQRVTIVKANALADIEGNEVYVLVTDHKRGVDVDQLSPKVKLIDLDINYYDVKPGGSTISHILNYKRNNSRHKKALKRVLREINPDIVISTGCFEKKIIALMRNRSWKTILENHYERNYFVKKGFHPLHHLIVKMDRQLREKKFDCFVVLTEEDKRMNWKGWENVAVIPNPSSFKCDEVSTLNHKSICSVGRLVKSKNFLGLIRSFQLVLKKHPDWTLDIYGEGPDRKRLELYLEQEGLCNNVHLRGFTSDVMGALKQSSIFAFTSLSEGFGMVIVDAMECGVPVVSYDCHCGPKEIITEGVDGFLIPLNNEKLMSERICELIEDENRRKQVGEAAKKKASLYSIDSIVARWMSLFNQLVER